MSSVTMRAVEFATYGGPEVLRVVDVPRPTVGAGEVLVMVAGVGFNPVDTAIRAGLLAGVLPIALPARPGCDIAGEVIELGPDAGSFAVGDHVIAMLPSKFGATAEYLAVNEASLAPAPTSIPLPDAAGLPGAGLTAFQAVHDHAAVRTGERVLVAGAGGAVGLFATQLVHGLGAEVIATAGPTTARRAREAGATLVVDYTSSPDYRDIEPVDVVLNFAPAPLARLYDLVKDGGRLVSTTTQVDDAPGRITAVRMAVRSDAEQLTTLSAMVDAGQLRVPIADRRLFSETALVHAGHAGGGKTILTP